MLAGSKKELPLVLGAIGIVYGDLGTSPLYAFRESLKGLALTPENIYGILSLFFWALILIISIKYLIIILRADNEGEGGILAMLALIKRKDERIFNFLYVIAILGASLLIGDGIITPAISVVSAVEGLNIITPTLSHLTLPISILILLLLYLSQYHGTEKIGNLFGPILVLWFITIAVLGISSIRENPMILKAINPYYAFHFFMQNGYKSYVLLGSVFLVVTGGEALYADLGQFGRTPIRFGWYGFVLPSLLLNYFGQGAHVLANPEALVNPFYSLAPDWFSYPLLIIATLATIIASQAVISATFSLTKQAVLMDFYPKVPIVQTSSNKKGHVYIPQMNFMLGVGSLCFVLAFKNSSAMASAYGIAINMEMFIITLLTSYVAFKIWRWSIFKIGAIFSLYIAIDVAFLGANAHKIVEGGWVAILFAIICGTLMTTWHQGIKHLQTHYFKKRGNLTTAIEELHTLKLKHYSKTVTVCITDPYDQSGGGLVQYFKLHRWKPEQILLLCINVENVPYVKAENRYELITIEPHIHRLILHIGFMQLINIPHTLSIAKKMKVFPFEIKVKKAIYLIELTNISATLRKRTLPFYWQEKLFAFLMRNSALDIEFYHLPYERTIAVGGYCEI